MKIIWIKYRRLSAAGYSGWQYKWFEDVKDYPAKLQIEEFFKEANSEYWWSDKHRGYEYHRVSRPPNAVVQKMVESLERAAKYKIDVAKTLRSKYNLTETSDATNARRDIE